MSLNKESLTAHPDTCVGKVVPLKSEIRPTMFYTYVLQSFSSGRLYIGSTQNISERLDRHNNNKEIATRNRGPWKVLAKQNFETRSEAVRLEMKLKKWKNKTRILQWVNKQCNE